MKEPKRVAITYNLKRITKNNILKTNDAEAEFDSPKTIAAVRTALEDLGYEVIALEANARLAYELSKKSIDIVFNMAEGQHGLNREAQVPALLELMGICYTGSDSKALTISLDKYLAKKIVAEAGVLTPGSWLIQDPNEISKQRFKFPLIVKPLAEGSSKGVTKKSVVHDEEQLFNAVSQNIKRYKQPALVEKYLAGREFTVGILQGQSLEVLPPMEIVFLQKDNFPIYSYESKVDYQNFLHFDTRPQLTKIQAAQLEEYAKLVFKALGCRDVARVDFRMDKRGRLYFLECNPLPGLSPQGSDLCCIARAAGLSHMDLIKRILSPALKRFANYLS